MCFGAVGLQPFLVFCVFVSLQKHSSSPENGLFCSFLSASLSFSLASFTSPFSLSVSLSLSLYFLFLVFFFLPCFLVFVLPCYLLLFLALFLCFCFTKKTTSNITFERFLFINCFLFLGGFLFCFVLQIPVLCFVCLFFQLCVFVNINVFIFQRRPFLNHPVLFCALCKVIVFLRADFEGRFG